MKAYIKEFNYPGKDGGISKRRCFVLREDGSAFDGLELTYLTKEQEKEVVEHFKNVEVLPNLVKVNPKIETFVNDDKEEQGFRSEVFKAYRRYNKTRILEDVDEENC